MLCAVVGFHGCHPEKRNNQVPLVVGAVGFGHGQPLGNLQGLLVVLARRVSLAQGLEQVAQLVVGYRQIALVVGAVGFCRGQPLGNLQGLLVVLARRVSLAQGLEQVAQLL